MSERSENAGVAVALGVALLLGLLLLIGGGVFFFLFARQVGVVRMEAERARANEAIARQNALQAQAAADSARAKPESASPQFASPEGSTPAVTSIEAMLRAQEQAWNTGNIDEFMRHYWKSDELTFSSGGQTTRGWDATMKRYRERYPTPEQMGQLKLDHFEITVLHDSAALVLGQWQVARESEPLRGNFSLVLRKLGDRWLIVHDHTSRLTE